MKFSKETYYSILIDLVDSCERKYGFLTTSLLASECVSCIHNFNKEDYTALLGLSDFVLEELEKAGVLRNNGSVYEQIMGFDKKQFREKLIKDAEAVLGD